MKKYKSKIPILIMQIVVLKKKLWRKFPFDEKLTNIEDRIWAKNIQKRVGKYCIPLIVVFTIIMVYIKTMIT